MKEPIIKATSKSKKQMIQYLDNYIGCTEHGSDWDQFESLSNDLVKKINSGEVKTVKWLAQELHGYSDEFVFPFTCSEDLY